MKINKIELIRFGKFKDTVIDLAGGVNTFCESNEWGKSTVTDFIIYMLYGFKKTASKKIGIEDNLLKKYLPWDDDSYVFGAIELEADGRALRIERKTLASGRMTLVVRDAGGTPIDMQNPGAELLGIDEQTFMRTFLVRQTDIVFDGTADIETALKNLVTTGDEQTSFDAALKIIVDKKNKYQHGDRRSGRIFDLPKLITEKKLERSQLAGKKDELSRSLDEYNALQEKLTAVEKTEKELETRRDGCIGNDAKELVARAEQLMAERESYAKKLADSQSGVTDADLAAATDVFNKTEVAKTYADNAEAQLAAAEEALAQSKTALAGLEYVGENKADIESYLAKDAKHSIPLIVAGALLAIVCSVLLTVSAFFMIGVIAGVAVAAAASFVKIQPKPIFDKTREQLTADYEKYKSVTAEILLKQKAVDDASVDCDVKNELLKNAQTELLKIKEKYGITELAELSALLAQTKNADMVRGHIKRLDGELATLLQGKELDVYRRLSQKADGSDLSVIELDAMCTHAAKQKSELSLSISQLERARVDCDTITEKINDLTVEITKLETELADAEYRNTVLTTARDVLTEAYDKINSVYSPIISQKIAPYLFTLTGGKYSEAVLDRQFSIRIKYKGEYKELGFFSRGTADCVYLAVRLAMAEILEGGKKLPLILDDPFWSFDSDRKNNADSLIRELARDRQILVFCAK